MYGITWSGAIGDNYSFDANGEVVGVSSVVGEILPVAERTEERPYKALGTALGWVWRRGRARRRRG